jgi:hypothetical protein
MPNPVVTVVPNDDVPAPRNAWGIAGIGVGLAMDRPYPPLEAMVVAGYILFGMDWPGVFKRLRLPASLENAYVALEAHFSRRQQIANPLVTVPRPAVQHHPQERPALTDGRPIHTALAPPERQQLTHQPASDTEASTTNSSRID